MIMDAVQQQAAILDEIVDRAMGKAEGLNAQRFGQFARLYLHRVPEDELTNRDPEDWAALVRNQFQDFSERVPRQTRVRIFNPTRDVHGWETGHTVIEILTGDKPFLVDSTTLAISEENISIHLIIHPVMWAKRDAGGYLMTLASLQETLDGGSKESVMHFEIDRVTEPSQLSALQTRIEAALGDVELAVRDWPRLIAQIDTVITDLEGEAAPHAEDGVEEAIAFLRWMTEDHFTFLGYRDYRIEVQDGQDVLVAIDDTGLGVLAKASGNQAAPSLVRSRDAMTIAQSGPIIVTKTNARSTVHRAGYMDYIGVMRFDDDGRLTGERRFLGLYTSAAYNRRPWQIPFVRRKVDAVIEASGLAPSSHGGKALLHIMEALPRDELFQATPRELFDLVIGIFDLQERRKTRLFVRRDRFGRFYSCLVFIPRDRFNTETRIRIQAILKRALGGESIDFTVQVSDAALARVHVIVHVRADAELKTGIDEIEARLVEAVRSWNDRLGDILTEKHGEDRGLSLLRRFGEAFPAAYREDVTPWVASFDVENLAALDRPGDLRMSLYRPRSRERDVFRFKIFRIGQTIPLSDVLPILENMGLRIVSERPYRLQFGDRTTWWIQDFDMQLVGGGDLDLDRVRHRFEDAFRQVVEGEAENDGFNRLIIAAGLDWRQVAMLRAYCKYLLQTGVPFSQVYMEQTLATHPGIVRALVELFEAQFDPRRAGESQVQQEARAKRLYREIGECSDDSLDGRAMELLEAMRQRQTRGGDAQIKAVVRFLRYQIERVRSLDDDRMLRGFMGAIRATLRTNFFQRKGAPYLCFKLDSGAMPELPKPRPWREIFVSSPRVEGIHLRGGPVARGGLRWSDRREDFRTEVLGLMKAQQVKNTLIVPVGAKGGFVVKRLPEVAARAEVMAEVVACYRFFIHALLDVTDNLVEETVVPPPDLVRRDGDDAYLVVAADKGTATFSDIANSVSEDHGFWLGDAFASGGSAGYDHKKMGITARGAWESVKRHFRELGVDCQREPFSVVGIGDMSGDVFGNGMLLSRKIRLRAAFNHLHIFLDPDPDPETSFHERERLFGLERSAWTDYDPALISEGGGVYARSAKEIPLSDQVREWLGVEATSLTPHALIRELLKAPMDLLWNGGIGTYVKASTETHADVGDRANEGVRVDGAELQARVVGEGGNLGLTQRGRIEYAQAGGRINTDALDNSAGVDCSDHEVNIKILLNAALREGDMGQEERNRLLADMTDEVASLVLKNNYLQAQAVSMMERLSVKRLGSKAHMIDVLEASGTLDRELEFLPSRDEIAERRKRGHGLTRPELCVLMAYGKMTVYDELLASDVPEDPYLSRELARYFPEPLRENHAAAMTGHRLRREIIATMVTNSIVNRMGATFALRMHEDTGAKTPEVAKAYAAAREIFGLRAWWAAVEGHDVKVPSDDQLAVQLEIWDLLRHQTRWLLHHHRSRLDIAELVERYREDVARLMQEVPAWTDAQASAELERRRSRLAKAGFGEREAPLLASVELLLPVLDMIDVAQEAGADAVHVATLYVRVRRSFRLGWLMDQIQSLRVDGQWHAHARGGLRDELYRHHRSLTARLLADVGPDGDPDAAVKAWIAEREEQLSFFDHMMRDMQDTGTMDYATVSVAVRALEQLVHSL